MIQEDYVSFETAKLLKENGFDYASFYCYEEKGDDVLTVILSAPLSNSDLDNTIEPHKCYSAPTLQMAMKWLREKHHIFIRVIQSHIEYCTCEIYYDIVRYHQFRESFNSYEEAAEAAIKYCLENLI